MFLQRLVAVGPTGYFDFRNVFFFCIPINSRTMNKNQTSGWTNGNIMLKYFQYTLFFPNYIISILF